tara:strand:- start:409 stop:945 length:537 start_codon:yes stop_codon:yes gene_type:complete
MSENYTYARPYAEAAFKISLEDNSGKEWTHNLLFLVAIIESEEIKEALANPKIANEERVKLLLSFFKKQANAHLQNFLTLLLEKKRIIFMKEISEIFENLKSDYNKVCNVEIETPYVLSSSQLKELENYLKLEYKSQIKIHQVINKELIAGIKIKVNNEVTDLSIRNRLENVTQHLMM